jgi:molybdate transport system regulatory protein
MPKSTQMFPSLSVRIDLAEGRIGPGKIKLLEAISDCGSIRAASQAMGMSYRRAWNLVTEINGLCASPAVAQKTGGKNGGGTTLTPVGLSLVASYREIECQVENAAHDELLALRADITELPDR